MAREIRETKYAERTVRVAFPAAVSFAGETFRVREFTTNLSVGGIFLPTERPIAPGTLGNVTFRISPWEAPFTVTAEVVHRSGDPVGVGIKFVDVDDATRKKLERLVSGARDGSVVQAIRRCVREERKDLTVELRRRPTDQKVMLAVGAKGAEIEALIRDGHPTVLQRLLDNPALNVGHVRTILKIRTAPTGFMIALKKYRRFTADEGVRALFCEHPNAPIPDAVDFLKTLPVSRLQAFERNTSVRPQVRGAAQDLLKRRAGRFR